jgi:hypothetical protein
VGLDKVFVEGTALGPNNHRLEDLGAPISGVLVVEGLGSNVGEEDHSCSRQMQSVKYTII